LPVVPVGRAVVTGRIARPGVDDAIVQALLPTNREPEMEDRELALRNAPGWRSAWLGSDQVRAWMRAGAYPEEAALVVALLVEGITDARADELVTHPDTGERMTLLDLARREHRPRQPRALQQALDDAEVRRDPRPYRWWAAPGA
jgi:hypothetical protein